MSTSRAVYTLLLHAVLLVLYDTRLGYATHFARGCTGDGMSLYRVYISRARLPILSAICAVTSRTKRDTKRLLVVLRCALQFFFAMSEVRLRVE